MSGSTSIMASCGYLLSGRSTWSPSEAFPYSRRPRSAHPVLSPRRLRLQCRRRVNEIVMRVWKKVILSMGAAVWMGAAGMAHAQAYKDRQTALAASVLPPGLRDVGLDQKLNEQAPLDLKFRDETGRELPLASYFGTRPVILALVY